MNQFDDLWLDQTSFAWRDLQGQDIWQPWTVTYSFTTATGLTVTGRYRMVGRQCFWQVKSTGTSLATTAGTDYIALPLTAQGLGGAGQMFNDTANTGVAGGGISVSDSRYYPPTQAASGNDFTFSGWYEV